MDGISPQLRIFQLRDCQYFINQIDGQIVSSQYPFLHSIVRARKTRGKNRTSYYLIMASEVNSRFRLRTLTISPIFLITNSAWGMLALVSTATSETLNFSFDRHYQCLVYSSNVGQNISYSLCDLKTLQEEFFKCPLRQSQLPDETFSSMLEKSAEEWSHFFGL